MRTQSRFSLLLAYAAMGVVALGLLALSGQYTGVPAQLSAEQVKSQQASDARLQKAWRFERGGWVFVHLEGSPHDIGYQHGFLLAPEIEDAFQAIRVLDTHNTKRNWAFFRKTAREVLWPHIDEEYQQELQGIADGLKARNVKMDVYDVVALNAFEEVPDYYVPWLEKQEKKQNAAHPVSPTAGETRVGHPADSRFLASLGMTNQKIPRHDKLVAPGNCSAFVATGSWTRDGKIVIAHNNWTSVISGARWRIMFDIVPRQGHRILMDGFPGVITSDDDFGMNDDGIVITETTITGFQGFDPNGKPEFVRSRKALQYAGSIDDYVRIMNDGNNGGYANDWLLGDNKTGEIARFEQGLKHTRVWRTRDGYFVGANFASDPQVIKDETDFDPEKPGTSPNARRARWEQLMKEYKGKIDVAAGQKFEADHYDTFDKKEGADERTLCGHVETSPRGVPEWGWGPYHPGGTVQSKVADAAMIRDMTLVARAGHACGTDFIAADFLAKHPEYAWQKPVLTDMKAGPWTAFKAGEKK
jgi:hypothetical protein